MFDLIIKNANLPDDRKNIDIAINLSEKYFTSEKRGLLRFSCLSSQIFSFALNFC